MPNKPMMNVTDEMIEKVMNSGFTRQELSLMLGRSKSYVRQAFNSGRIGIVEWNQILKIVRRPDAMDVRKYAESIGFPEIDEEYFVRYYTERGWKRNGKAIRDWKRCVVTWKNNFKNYNSSSMPAESPAPENNHSVVSGDVYKDFQRFEGLLKTYLNTLEEENKTNAFLKEEIEQKRLELKKLDAEIAEERKTLSELEDQKKEKTKWQRRRKACLKHLTQSTVMTKLRRRMA